MTAILYYGLVLPLSRLPLAVLYRFSDFLFLAVYLLGGYRKKIVLENLRRSFPEKSPIEIRSIARAFYRHFCDLVCESIRAFTISDREIRKRMVCVNPRFLDRYFEEGKSVIVVGGHYGNWEWFGVAVSQQVRHVPVGIYKPLTNRFLDEKMRETRGKYGLRLLPIREVPAFFEGLRSSPPEKPSLILFAADQSPGDSRKAHWMRFLNQDTGAVFGPEKYAKEYDIPVVYGVIRKKRRGYYEFEFQPLSDQPRSTAHGEIIERSNRLLEADIVREPRYWLWTHRRWKHLRPD